MVGRVGEETATKATKECGGDIYVIRAKRPISHTDIDPDVWRLAIKWFGMKVGLTERDAKELAATLVDLRRKGFVNPWGGVTVYLVEPCFTVRLSSYRCYWEHEREIVGYEGSGHGHCWTEYDDEYDCDMEVCEVNLYPGDWVVKYYKYSAPYEWRRKTEVYIGVADVSKIPYIDTDELIYKADCAIHRDCPQEKKQKKKSRSYPRSYRWR